MKNGTGERICTLNGLITGYVRTVVVSSYNSACINGIPDRSQTCMPFNYSA
jgi:hypothetical protein